MNKINTFYKDRFNSFLVHLSKAKGLKEEDVHKLRVDIKNIRSLLLLVDAFEIEGEAVGKILQQLQSIFKYSGRLRSIQVSKLLVDNCKLKNQKPIVNVLEEQRSKYEDELSKRLGKFKITKFQKKVDILNSALDKVDIKDAREKADRIIRDELDLIYKLWASSRGEEYYHDIRKFFKIIKSILQLLTNLLDDEKLKSELSIVNETETILGNWHDRDVLDKKLSKMQSTSPNAEFKSLVREIKNKNRTEKNNLSKEFKKKMLTHFLKH